MAEDVARKKAVSEMLGEALREVSVLAFTFGMLDSFMQPEAVKDRLLEWRLEIAGFSLGVGFIGVLIEVLRKPG